ncbi:hypothetical protein ACIQVK_18745 [Streptomyces sp. NPDC090493]|uniref:hypothetical protein n=1 Tax=Streptomyces sp. NPDC090493 TaxID=3365964 RepID=UPI00382C38F2
MRTALPENSESEQMNWRGLSVCVVRQGKPSGKYHDSRMKIGDLEDRDAAEIRAGRALLLEVQLIRRPNAKATPVVLDTLYNRVASPESVGSYSHPEQIIDVHLRRDATDLWASEFRRLLFQQVQFRGRTYEVLSLEDTDGEYADEGYLTGYAICRRTDFAPSGNPCNPKRLPLHELKPTTRKST